MRLKMKKSEIKLGSFYKVRGCESVGKIGQCIAIEKESNDDEVLFKFDTNAGHNAEGFARNEFRVLPSFEFGGDSRCLWFVDIENILEEVHSNTVSKSKPLLDLTKPIETRYGRKVEILKTNLNGEYPILALIDNEDIESYTLDGNYFINADFHSLDLVNVSAKYSKWINIYNEGDGEDVIMHDTKESADEGAISARIACINIEFEEGDGLND